MPKTDLYVENNVSVETSDRLSIVALDHQSFESLGIRDSLKATLENPNAKQVLVIGSPKEISAWLAEKSQATAVAGIINNSAGVAGIVENGTHYIFINSDAAKFKGNPGRILETVRHELAHNLWQDYAQSRLQTNDVRSSVGRDTNKNLLTSEPYSTPSEKEAFKNMLRGFSSQELSQLLTDAQVTNNSYKEIINAVNDAKGKGVPLTVDFIDQHHPGAMKEMSRELVVRFTEGGDRSQHLLRKYPTLGEYVKPAFQDMHRIGLINDKLFGDIAADYTKANLEPPVSLKSSQPYKPSRPITMSQFKEAVGVIANGTDSDGKIAFKNASQKEAALEMLNKRGIASVSTPASDTIQIAPEDMRKFKSVVALANSHPDSMASYEYIETAKAQPISNAREAAQRKALEYAKSGELFVRIDETDELMPAPKKELIRLSANNHVEVEGVKGHFILQPDGSLKGPANYSNNDLAKTAEAFGISRADIDYAEDGSIKIHKEEAKGVIEKLGVGKPPLQTPSNAPIKPVTPSQPPIRKPGAEEKPGPLPQMPRNEELTPEQVLSEKEAAARETARGIPGQQPKKLTPEEARLAIGIERADSPDLQRQKAAQYLRRQTNDQLWVEKGNPQRAQAVEVIQDARDVIRAAGVKGKDGKHINYLDLTREADRLRESGTPISRDATVGRTPNELEKPKSVVTSEPQIPAAVKEEPKRKAPVDFLVYGKGIDWDAYKAYETEYSKAHPEEPKVKFGKQQQNEMGPPSGRESAPPVKPGPAQPTEVPANSAPTPPSAKVALVPAADGVILQHGSPVGTSTPLYPVSAVPTGQQGTQATNEPPVPPPVVKAPPADAMTTQQGTQSPTNNNVKLAPEKKLDATTVTNAAPPLTDAKGTGTRIKETVKQHTQTTVKNYSRYSTAKGIREGLFEEDAAKGAVDVGSGVAGIVADTSKFTSATQAAEKLSGKLASELTAAEQKVMRTSRTQKNLKILGGLSYISAEAGLGDALNEGNTAEKAQALAGFGTGAFVLTGAVAERVGQKVLGKILLGAAGPVGTVLLAADLAKDVYKVGEWAENKVNHLITGGYRDAMQKYEDMAKEERFPHLKEGQKGQYVVHETISKEGLTTFDPKMIDMYKALPNIVGQPEFGKFNSLPELKQNFIEFYKKAKEGKVRGDSVGSDVGESDRMASLMAKLDAASQELFTPEEWLKLKKREATLYAEDGSVIAAGEQGLLRDEAKHEAAPFKSLSAIVQDSDRAREQKLGALREEVKSLTKEVDVGDMDKQMNSKEFKQVESLSEQMVELKKRGVSFQLNKDDEKQYGKLVEATTARDVMNDNLDIQRAALVERMDKQGLKPEEREAALKDFDKRAAGMDEILKLEQQKAYAAVMAKDARGTNVVDRMNKQMTEQLTGSFIRMEASQQQQLGEIEAQKKLLEPIDVSKQLEGVSKQAEAKEAVFKAEQQRLQQMLKSDPPTPETDIQKQTAKTQKALDELKPAAERELALKSLSTGQDNIKKIDADLATLRKEEPDPAKRASLEAAMLDYRSQEIGKMRKGLSIVAQEREKQLGAKQDAAEKGVQKPTATIVPVLLTYEQKDAANRVLANYDAAIKQAGNDPAEIKLVAQYVIHDSTSRGAGKGGEDMTPVEYAEALKEMKKTNPAFKDSPVVKEMERQLKEQSPELATREKALEIARTVVANAQDPNVSPEQLATATKEAMAKSGVNGVQLTQAIAIVKTEIQSADQVKEYRTLAIVRNVVARPYLDQKDIMARVHEDMEKSQVSPAELAKQADKMQTSIDWERKTIAAKEAKGGLTADEKEELEQRKDYLDASEKALKKVQEETAKMPAKAVPDNQVTAEKHQALDSALQSDGSLAAKKASDGKQAEATLLKDERDKVRRVAEGRNILNQKPIGDNNAVREVLADPRVETRIRKDTNGKTIIEIVSNRDSVTDPQTGKQAEDQFSRKQFKEADPNHSQVNGAMLEYTLGSMSRDKSEGPNSLTLTFDPNNPADQARLQEMEAAIRESGGIVRDERTPEAAPSVKGVPVTSNTPEPVPVEMGPPAPPVEKTAATPTVPVTSNTPEPVPAEMGPPAPPVEKTAATPTVPVTSNTPEPVPEQMGPPTPPVDTAPATPTVPVTSVATDPVSEQMGPPAPKVDTAPATPTVPVAAITTEPVPAEMGPPAPPVEKAPVTPTVPVTSTTTEAVPVEKATPTTPIPKTATDPLVKGETATPLAARKPAAGEKSPVPAPAALTNDQIMNLKGNPANKDPNALPVTDRSVTEIKGTAVASLKDETSKKATSVTGLDKTGREFEVINKGRPVIVSASDAAGGLTEGSSRNIKTDGGAVVVSFTKEEMKNVKIRTGVTKDGVKGNFTEITMATGAKVTIPGNGENVVIATLDANSATLDRSMSAKAFGEAQQQQAMLEQKEKAPAQTPVKRDLPVADNPNVKAEKPKVVTMPTPEPVKETVMQKLWSGASKLLGQQTESAQASKKQALIDKPIVAKKDPVPANKTNYTVQATAKKPVEKENPKSASESPVDLAHLAGDIMLALKGAKEMLVNAENRAATKVNLDTNKIAAAPVASSGKPSTVTQL